MKLIVVIEGEWDSCDPEAIFTTQELADAYIKEGEKLNNSYTTKELTLDEFANSVVKTKWAAYVPYNGSAASHRGKEKLWVKKDEPENYYLAGSNGVKGYSTVGPNHAMAAARYGLSQHLNVAMLTAATIYEVGTDFLIKEGYIPLD